MKLVILRQSIPLMTAFFAVAAVARAGCNCNVPPSPGVYPVSNGFYPQGMPAMGSMGSAWNTPMPLSPTPINGMANPGIQPGMAMPQMGMGPSVGMPGSPMGVAPGGYAGQMPYPGYGPSAMPYGGLIATNGPHWAPGGYEGRVGSPAYFYDPSGGQYVVTGDPYYDHFGPGFHRSSLHGHYRFPYYNYRTPWYYPGRAVYNRNTNFAW